VSDGRKGHWSRHPARNSSSAIPAVNGYPCHSSYGHLGSSPPNDLRAKFQVPARARSTTGRVFEATHTAALMIMSWLPHISLPSIDGFRRLLARSCRSGMSAVQSLLGVDRTWSKRPESVASDPERTGGLAYSITSSARASDSGGMVRPSDFAVARLTMKRNFVGCSIGRSPGFVPLRILSTKEAARRNCSGKSTL
jgi:hypothetical protein